MQFTLNSEGRSVVVEAGSKLSHNDFPFLSPKSTITSESGSWSASEEQEVGCIVPNPVNAQSLGIQNLSSSPWLCTLPDNSSVLLRYNQVTELVAGMIISIGDYRIKVAAQADDDPEWVVPKQQIQLPYLTKPSFEDEDIDNDSGTGSTAKLPYELEGFNWGAFLLPLWWSLSMSSYLGLLCMVPCAGIIMMFILGFKGNEWAWQNREWDSVEHFVKVQRIWIIWGIVINIISVYLYYLYSLSNTVSH